MEFYAVGGENCAGEGRRAVAAMRRRLGWRVSVVAFAGVAGVASIGGCTVTADDFEPGMVTMVPEELMPSGAAGAVGSPEQSAPAPAEGDGSQGGAGSEGSGGALPLAPGDGDTEASSGASSASDGAGDEGAEAPGSGEGSPGMDPGSDGAADDGSADEPGGEEPPPSDGAPADDGAPAGDGAPTGGDGAPTGDGAPSDEDAPSDEGNAPGGDNDDAAPGNDPEPPLDPEPPPDPDPVVPPSSPCASLQFGGRCYEIFAGLATWEVAEQQCVAWGGHLASVGSAEEDAFLASWPARLGINGADGSNLWLGGTDAALDGVFRWSDGTPFQFSSFAAGQPDNGVGVDCIVKRNDGTQRWYDLRCTDLARFACERAL